MSSQETATAMRAHHAAMAEEFQARTQALAAAQADWTSARDRVVEYLIDDVLPHAQAEESTIYRTALTEVTLSTLVQSMIWEHIVIGELAQALKDSHKRDDALMIAGQAAKLFWVHAEKENRYIIAALEPRADIDLDSILSAMRESLTG